MRLDDKNTKKDILNSIGFLGYCKTCDQRWSVKFERLDEDFINHKHPVQITGPVWLGILHNPFFLTQMCSLLDSNNSDLKLLKFVKRCQAESKDFPPWFYDVHKQSKRYKIKPKPMDVILDSIRNDGYLAERTHISNTGIKSTVNIREYLY